MSTTFNVLLLQRSNLFRFISSSRVTYIPILHIKIGEVLRVWEVLPMADMGGIAVSYFVNYVLISAELYKLECLYSLMVYNLH